MIKVCDAIMGTGKSSAAITYMNEHPDDKFIYITPYLDEAARIHKGCPSLGFVEPKNLKQYGFRKLSHTADLIEEGKNIATTHQAFKRYTPEVLENIRKHGYTLIIDENVDVLERSEIHPDDLRMAVDCGYVRDDDGIYSLVRDDYEGTMFTEVFSLLRSRQLIRVVCDGKVVLYYWVLPPDLLSAFKDVFILTYLFEGQSLYHFMKIYDLPYEHIGVEQTQDGGYRFGPSPGQTPGYVTSLKDKIHIVDNERMNGVGDDKYALSKQWFQRGGDGVEQLKRNVSNAFNNVWRDIPSENRLWGTYKSAINAIKGKGYTKSFVVFNTKATNAYRDRDCLAYAVNIFMNVNEKLFYQRHGIEVNEDLYALSVMIQWIWRSAIRDGKDIYLYIPSSRMRRLLVNWIDNVSGGGTGHV